MSRMEPNALFDSNNAAYDSAGPVGVQGTFDFNNTRKSRLAAAGAASIGISSAKDVVSISNKFEKQSVGDPQGTFADDLPELDLDADSNAADDEQQPQQRWDMNQMESVGESNIMERNAGLMDRSGATNPTKGS